MANIHPDWQATEDDDAIAAPVAEPLRVEAPTMDILAGAPETVTVSRRPAAIVGILVAAALGFGAFQGFGALLGQTASDAIAVTITKTGLVPMEIRVKPGQEITWTNEDDIPHILTSTLLTNEEKPMQTSPIFKGSKATVTVSPLAQSGSFDYGSRTSPKIAGKIIIDIPLPPAAPSSASSVSTTTGTGAIPALPQPPSQALPPSPQTGLPFNPTAPIPQAPSTPIPTSTLAGVVPENPFTVGSPLAAQTAQAQSEAWTAMGAQTSSKPAPAITKVKPKAQPETGPGIWLIVGGSIGLLFVLTRKSFAFAKR